LLNGGRQWLWTAVSAMDPHPPHRALAECETLLLFEALCRESGPASDANGAGAQAVADVPRGRRPQLHRVRQSRMCFGIRGASSWRTLARPARKRAQKKDTPEAGNSVVVCAAHVVATATADQLAAAALQPRRAVGTPQADVFRDAIAPRAGRRLFSSECG
jgi:hypothetical protein